MGKPRRSRASEDATTTGSSGATQRAAPFELLPLAVARQADSAPPITTPTTELRAWLAPEVMQTAGLGSGDIVAMAVVDGAPGVEGGGRSDGVGSVGAPLSALALDSPMRVAPALPPAASLSPASLWTTAAKRFGVHPPSAPTATDPSSPMGEFLVLCSVWPSPRLPAATAALSPALWNALMQPLPGGLLLLYPCPRPAGGGSNVDDNVDREGVAGANCFSLEVCTSGTAGLPATLVADSSPKLSAQQPASSPRTPSRRGSSRGTPVGKASRPEGVTVSAEYGNKAEFRAAGLAEMLATGGRRQIQMLETLARCHLEGRWLLPGNPVLLPMLGAESLFYVADIDGEAKGKRAMRVSMHSRCVLRLPVQTGGATSDRRSESVAAVEAAVEAAREAAREAAVSEEAACRAAEAAATAGLAGGGVDFHSLGGVQEQMQVIRRMVKLPLQSPELLKSYGVQAPAGVLLHGPPGTGKTLLARAAAADASAALFVINGPDVVSEFYGESEAGLLGVWAAARAAAPAVIFLDEVDAIAGGREAGASSGRLVTSLLQLMDRNATGGGGNSPSSSGVRGSSGDGPARVVVLAASNRPDALDPALRRPGRFDSELEVGVPTPAARLDILKVRLKGVRHCLDEQQLRRIADGAHGYVGADLAALVNDAALNALRRQVKEAGSTQPMPSDSMAVTPADFELAKTHVMPSAMREVSLEVPSVRWDDIGGQQQVKQSLKEAVEWPFTHGDALRRLGATPPAGVLLYGPPGCSKTLLARACACEAGLNFLAIKGPELYSKWVGESEKAVAALFQRARAAAPSIVFFDEIDGLAGLRQDGGGGGAPSVEERVLSQLLSEMDGLLSRQGVIVLAATNRPDCVDAALLRPGRFDRLVYVPPPDCEAREAIFRVHLRRTAVAEDVSLAALARRTEHYTGADISSVCREAALAALEEDIDAEVVADRHFGAALDSVSPSGPVSWANAAMYRRFSRAGNGGDEASE